MYKNGVEREAMLHYKLTYSNKVKKKFVHCHDLIENTDKDTRIYVEERHRKLGDIILVK